MAHWNAFNLTSSPEKLNDIFGPGIHKHIEEHKRRPDFYGQHGDSPRDTRVNSFGEEVSWSTDDSLCNKVERDPEIVQRYIDLSPQEKKDIVDRTFIEPDFSDGQFYFKASEANKVTIKWVKKLDDVA